MVVLDAKLLASLGDNWCYLLIVGLDHPREQVMSGLMTECSYRTMNVTDEAQR